ncbi:IclR family transcriptional regulator [Dietzia sp. CH92]|uniref:IclR family transcriptional regulator n=1 Tax=Dietzia sp. CH92 TaxID=3051823 RepID=UPI0028D2FEC4|nr:IclR family transcriptional regulator [Dietzia sp. CH92]
MTTVDQAAPAGRDDDTARATSADYVQSLARGLAVIRAFGADNPRQTLSEVARNTGLTRATARRFLLTLVELGYVDFDGSTFELTPRILDLGYSFLSATPLPDVAQPHLKRLSTQLGESSSVSILDGPDIVYVGRVQVSRIMTVGITIGTRFPAYATSMGRCLLAGLEPWELDDYFGSTPIEPRSASSLSDEAALRAAIDLVREQGWCLVDQELEPGLRSLAAPVRDSENRTVAAINISTHAMRYTPRQLVDEFVSPLLATADAITRDLVAVNR